MELEYVDLELADSQIEEQRKFSANIHLIKDELPHVFIHCDCQVAIAIAENKS